jgi:hypothetical protein
MSCITQHHAMGSNPYHPFGPHPLADWIDTMPTVKKAPQKSAAQKARVAQIKYHVFEIAADLGQVSGHKDPVDAINAAYPQPVAKGRFLVIDPTGEATIVTLRETSTVTTEMTSPKDLFT